MLFSCLYTTRKTQKCKRWQDGFLQVDESSHTFSLLDDSNTVLTAGVLKKPVLSLFTDDNDEAQFEQREYLICVEKDVVCHRNQNSVPIVLPSKSPISQRNFKRLEMIPRKAEVRNDNATSSCSENESDFICPNIADDNIDTNLIDFLEPRKSTTPFGSDVDSLLSLLTSVSSTCKQQSKENIIETKSNCRLMNQINNGSLHISCCTTSQSSPSTVSLPLGMSTPGLSPPCIQQIQQKEIAYYVMQVKSDPTTIPMYQQLITDLVTCVIKYTIFTAFSTVYRVFKEQKGDIAILSSSDVAPPLSWFKSATSFFKDSTVSIWTDCSLRVKDEEEEKRWKKGKRARIEEEEEEIDCSSSRYFLTIPCLSSSKDSTKEGSEGDSSSLMNCLIYIMAEGCEGAFYRILWHGCTANHLIEVTPFSLTLQSLRIHSVSRLTVINCGSIDVEAKILDGLYRLPSLRVSPFIALSCPPVSHTAPSPSFPFVFLQRVKSLLLQQFSLNMPQQEVVDYVIRFFQQENDGDDPHCRLRVVQGVFGSGKSLLISSLIVLFNSLQSAKAAILDGKEKKDFLNIAEDAEAIAYLKTSPPSRRLSRRSDRLSVLFCSHTNVAVDRVCLMLKERGFDDFRRGGNVRKIHPSLRQYYTTKKFDDHRCEMNVLCTTICSIQADIGDYDVVIIDEASQITEYHVSLLPLLLTNPQFVILIGDQKQLPPPPIQGIAPLSQSMFERLLRHLRVLPLLTQYRCHPAIAQLASSLFYNESLTNGPNTAMLPLPLPQFPRLLFIDHTAVETPHRESFVNEGELLVLQGLLKRIRNVVVEEDSATPTIGIISLYAAQCWALNHRVASPTVQVSTVDAFQGNEKDVIILSTVRSTSVGFTADPQRLNVAITRAKCQLIIVGNRGLLEKSVLWKQVISYIEKEGRVISLEQLQSI